MSSAPFSIVDVFSTTPYKGNPLAIVDSRGQKPTDAQLKLIARQFNLSETTYFFPPTSPEADYRLRSFLPDGREVFGAGHNILGVWWYLAQANLVNLSAPTASDEKNEEFVFHQELGGQVIPVKITRARGTGELSVAIRQARPQAHAVHPDPASLARSFGLTAEDIGFKIDNASTKSLPPQVMSTSTTRHLHVPIASVEALNRAVVQRDKLLEQLRMVDEKSYGLYLFTPVHSADGKMTFQARFFSPGMSGEDPATGSAAGPLSTYLYNHGVLRPDEGVARIVVHQGLRVGRECVINVQLTTSNEGDREVADVDIIGGGVEVASGHIALPGLETTF